MTIHNIYFKVHTTNSDTHSGIVQLAAVPEDRDEKTFNEFVLPEKEISRGATDLHHIFESEGKLFRSRPRHNLEILDALEPWIAYEKFVQYLDDQFLERRDDKVRLIGHNISRFDAHVLVYNMRNNGISNYKILDRIDSLSDTRTSFQHFHRDLDSYSHQSLMRYFGMARTRTYDAFMDAEDLRDLVDRAIKKRDQSRFFEKSEQDFRDICDIYRHNYPSESDSD